MGRVVDVSERGCRLSIDCGCLSLFRGEEDAVVISLDDIDALLLSESAVSLTGSVLAGLAERGVALISCDSHYLPVGVMQPMVACHNQTEVLAGQVRTGKVVRKRLWQSLIRQKIRHQASILEMLLLNGTDLRAMSTKVLSGDPRNLEAYAARLYWQRLNLFSVRNRYADDANRLFNYAYAVVFAATARAVCAAGLHPGFGIRHHHRYNPFCLASDLMEPYRVLADHAVIFWLDSNGRNAAITKEAKRAILQDLLNARVMVDGRRETIFAALTRSAVSLRNCLYANRYDLLLLPDFISEQRSCG